MKANILVVDDDAEIRELLAQVLQRSNYQVTQVKDAASMKERPQPRSNQTWCCWITSCPTRPASTCCR